MATEACCLMMQEAICAFSRTPAIWKNSRVWCTPSTPAIPPTSPCPAPPSQNTLSPRRTTRLPPAQIPAAHPDSTPRRNQAPPVKQKPLLILKSWSRQAGRSDKELTAEGGEENGLMLEVGPTFPDWTASR